MYTSLPFLISFMLTASYVVTSFIFGFFAMGLFAYKTLEAHVPFLALILFSSCYLPLTWPPPLSCNNFLDCQGALLTLRPCLTSGLLVHD